MKKSRFTETQIFSILKEVDTGMKVETVCRKHGIATRLTTTGNQNAVAWTPLNSNVCVSLRKKTPS